MLGEVRQGLDHLPDHYAERTSLVESCLLLESKHTAEIYNPHALLPQPRDIVTELRYEQDQPYSAFTVSREGIARVRDGWGGSPNLELDNRTKFFYGIYVNKLRQQEGDFESTLCDDSECEMVDMLKGRTPTQSMSRKAKKALEKELPYREVLQMDQNVIDKFIEAAKTQEKSWMENRSISQGLG